MSKAIKILVVEDDEFFRRTIKECLVRKSFEVVEASNGRIAKEILAVQRFDLVLSDIQMPHLDGVELLTWTKSNHSSVRFILMSGFSNLIESKTAQELGADDFLAKPFRFSRLIEVLTLHGRKENLVA